MANGPEKPMAPYKGTKFKDDLPFIDSLEPGKALPNAPSGLPRNWVKPEDRVAKVTAKAPKMETESAPMGDIFTPDRSGVSSIHDK